jgi:succinate dehydrogenase/fumarate reductase flavoprotein subunit
MNKQSYSVNLTVDEWDEILCVFPNWSDFFTSGYMWRKYGVSDEALDKSDIDEDYRKQYQEAMTAYISICKKVEKKQRADNKWINNIKKENETLKKEIDELKKHIQTVAKVQGGQMERDADNLAEAAQKIEDLKEDIKVLNDDKEELFNAWLFYWSGATQGKEHSILMSEWDGGKFQRILDGEE